MQNSDIYSILEKVATEAVSRTQSLTINKNPIAISYGSDEKEFVLYLGLSNAAANGYSLFDGWTSFAFVANRPLSQATVGERIMGRRLTIDGKKTFNKIRDSLSGNVKIGSYSGMLDNDEKPGSDLPLVMSTDLFRGTWAIIPDKTIQKIQRVWLIKKK